MTTVKELKEYLETIPDETEVYVLQVNADGYTSSAREVSLNFMENIEFSDLTNNKFYSKKERKRKTLTFGVIN